MVSKRLGLADVKAKRDRVEAPSQDAWGLVALYKPLWYSGRGSVVWVLPAVAFAVPSRVGGVLG